ncbi:MAG: hypothetical protein AMJ56_18300 [Anaerolineae bacterium SG8_19]|jgi:hypothetical protein|nr:MAG: hypothetical protein AMJ56_18300 [Anaerolineae bacterium SG8_19]
MNTFLEMLQEGDLRSDGQADEVAEIVLEHPDLFGDLFAGLWEPDAVIRAHTAHALEKVSRHQPQLMAGRLPQLVTVARGDEVPMVRWHLAMILANLVILRQQSELIWSTLLDLLADQSVFVRSWSISGLTVFGKAYPDRRAAIIRRLEPLCEDPSKAVRNRATKAVEALRNDDLPVPKGWLKGQGP